MSTDEKTTNQLVGMLLDPQSNPASPDVVEKGYAWYTLSKRLDADPREVERLRGEFLALASSQEAPARIMVAPPFPKLAYVGLAAEFAELYSEHLESPLQFFYMDFLTMLGAIVCKSVRLRSELDEPPRLFQIKVGKSWLARKSYSQEKTLNFFWPLIGSDETFKVARGVGSDRGLARDLSGKRYVMMYDEFSHFVDKCRTSALLPMTTSLFNTVDYDSPVKDDNVRVRDGHLVIMGACTHGTYERMFTSEYRNIGFLNRLFLVWGEREKQIPFPEEIHPDRKNALRERVKAVIARTLQTRPVFELVEGSPARRLYEEWSRDWMKDGPNYARLDTILLRLLPLFALVTQSHCIERAHIEALIPLMECQYETRKALDPLDTENKIARCERNILQTLTKGRMAEGRLKDLTHMKRAGIWLWQKGWENLEKEGYVQKIKSGRGWQCLITEKGQEYLDGDE